MIHLLLGDNSFLRDEAIRSLTGGGAVERIDGSELAASSLPDIFAGQSLFSPERVIVIDGASQGEAWDSLPVYLERGSDSTLLFVEAKLDKRSASYKSFAKHAAVVECALPSQRDQSSVETWLRDYASANTVSLQPDAIKTMIQRATRFEDKTSRVVIDQPQLATVVEQLKGYGDVSAETIEAVMAPSSYENVFELFSLALQSKQAELSQMLTRLRRTEEPHRLLALVIAQAHNLTALVLAREKNVPMQTVAKDIGAHPFALQTLGRSAQAVNRADLREIIEALTEADLAAKSGAEPWQAVEVALQKIMLR